MANIFMLVHASLPHSHHDGIVCFSTEKVAHHDCAGQHGNSDCCTHNGNEKHHHHDTTDNCDLRDVVMRQGDSHEDIILCANCLSLMYIYYTLNEFYLEEPQFGERLQQKPYLDTYISPFVGTIASLRAPPAYFLG